jgi:hypothetical protein
MTDFHGEPTRVLENEFLRLEYLTGAPRIVRCSPAGGHNLFADLGRTPLETQYGEFRFRGGHRLWHSPEAMPRTYMPDNEGAVVSELEHGVALDQPAESWTHISKRLEIRLNPARAQVFVRHELRNEGAWAVELAPWALTMFRQGGVGIFPQPAGPVDAAGLLPNRQVTLWPYAAIDDPRVGWADDFVLIRAEPRMPPFKLGYFSRAGWIAYWLEGALFVIRSDARLDAARYPDGGCSVESYCNDRFFELETLGALTMLAPGESVVHDEIWELYAGLEHEFIPDALRRRLT